MEKIKIEPKIEPKSNSYIGAVTRDAIVNASSPAFWLKAASAVGISVLAVGTADKVDGFVISSIRDTFSQNPTLPLMFPFNIAAPAMLASFGTAVTASAGGIVVGVYKLLRNGVIYKTSNVDDLRTSKRE